jgi:hypothetical protein
MGRGNRHSLSLTQRYQAAKLIFWIIKKEAGNLALPASEGD